MVSSAYSRQHFSARHIDCQQDDVSGTWGTWPSRLPSSTTEAAWLAASRLLPTAMPTSAAASAGASFTPSPTMATT